MKAKSLIFSISILVLTFQSCRRNEEIISPDPIADFSTSLSSATSGKVNFSNLSSNASSYTWTFGDGTSSFETNPSHVYSTNADYSVTLTANSDGKTNSISKTVTVTNSNVFSYYLTGVGTIQNKLPISHAYKVSGVNQIGITAQSTSGTTSFQIFLPYPVILFHEYTIPEVSFTHTSTTGVQHAGSAYAGSDAKITINEISSSRIKGVFSGKVVESGGFYMVSSGIIDTQYSE